MKSFNDDYQGSNGQYCLASKNFVCSKVLVVQFGFYRRLLAETLSKNEEQLPSAEKTFDEVRL